MLDRLNDYDVRLFLWFNGHHSPLWDHIMWFISGRYEWIPVYIIMASYLIYCYRWKSVLIILSVALTVTLADQIAVHWFKNVFMRLRPTYNPAIQNFVHIVNNYRGGPYGFVSNHAADTFAFATFMSLFFRNRVFTIIAILWAIIVSYSRIYLGVHYPGDVLGGAFIGAFLGFLVYVFYSSKLAKIGNR